MSDDGVGSGNQQLGRAGDVGEDDGGQESEAPGEEGRAPGAAGKLVGTHPEIEADGGELKPARSRVEREGGAEERKARDGSPGAPVGGRASRGRIGRGRARSGRAVLGAGGVGRHSEYYQRHRREGEYLRTVHRSMATSARSSRS